MYRELAVNVENGMAVDDLFVSHGSPPAPALPPRRYRGEMDLRMVDPLPRSRQAPSMRSVDSTNGESTLPHDTYANQLRRQARRYQHSRGSSFSHPRPPPDWKPPPPPALPHDLPLQPSVDDSPSCRTSFGSDQRKSRAEVVSCLSHVSDSEAGKSWIQLTSNSNSDTNRLEFTKSWGRSSLPVVDAPNSDAGLSPRENKTSEVQHFTAKNNLQSSRDGSTVLNFSGGQNITSSSLVTSGHPVVDVVSGYDRYYSIGDDHPTTSLSRSFSSIIPSDSWSSEVPSARRLSQPAVHLTRHETSPRNAESLTAERSKSSLSLSIDSEYDSSIDQKAQSTSTVELPTERSHLDNTVEVKPDSESSSKDLQASSKVDEEVTQSPPEVMEFSLTELKFFRRQKFPVELDCARQAEIVAGMLQKMERDETLVNILAPSSGHRTATNFMTKVLEMADRSSYDGLPESLRLRLSARDTCHAAL